VALHEIAGLRLATSRQVTERQVGQCPTGHLLRLNLVVAGSLVTLESLQPVRIESLCQSLQQMLSDLVDGIDVDLVKQLGQRGSLAMVNLAASALSSLSRLDIRECGDERRGSTGLPACPRTRADIWFTASGGIPTTKIVRMPR
jgi:hypothetical protein